MRRFVRATLLAGMLTGVWLGSQDRSQGASPAPTSYAAIEKSIATIREAWAKPEATPDPNAPGWNLLFDSLLENLKQYSKAESSEARMDSLTRIERISNALATVAWPPANQLQADLNQWLQPRVKLAWAERRLDETVRNLPPTQDAAVQANRQRWIEFVNNDLGKALAQYNSAGTVSQRQEGLQKVHDALGSLRTRNSEWAWQPSWDLQNAVNEIFNQPNLDITADVSVVAPLFDQNLVTSGPVYRKGYWSQVTAGPKTGFGLLPSDNGIAFYNSQMLTSVTPITDFQNQIASDPQGQRAAKLYSFSATSYDWAQLTIYTVLNTSGLSIWPAYNHNIDAGICSAPAQGGGLGRLIAGAIGLNQDAITQKVREGAVEQFRQRIPQEAQEEAQERIAGEQATRNAEIQRVLVGNNTASIQDFLVTGLSLRSRPEAVYVGGLLQSRDGRRQRGADSPQPASLYTPDAGVTADVHLVSVLNGVGDGLFSRPAVQTTENLMILTKDVPPGTPPKDAVIVRRNVDFPTYLGAVEEAQQAKNPKVTAIRVKKPSQAPDFAADAKGNLVAIFKDVEIEVPAPDKSTQAGSVIGVPAKVLRIQMPQVEIGLAYKVDSTTPGNHHVTANIVDFTPAPTSQVLAIEDDETKASPLTRFSGALVISSLGARLRSQPIETSLDNLNLRGYGVQSVSPLDPSGWVRVNLVQVAPVNAPDVVPPVITPDAPAAPAPATAPAAAAANLEPTADATVE